MQKISLTIVALVVGIIVTVVQKAGIDIAPEKVQTTIETILQIGAAIGVYYGRYRQGDINFVGIKTSNHK